MQRSEIATGGPIPDRRGFQGVNDPRYQEVLKEGVVTRRVAGQVYVIAGAGGNIAVQAGDDGLLLVDDNFKVFYDQIMASIRRISDKPIRIVVNTHSHPDHLENNENMFQQGALVFAHPNTRIALMRQGQPPAAGAPATAQAGRVTGAPVPAQGHGGAAPIPPVGWPTITSNEPMTFHFNGEDVMYVPLKPSHTNGDVAVYFTRSDVFAFGDVYTTDYPSINVAQGGTIENFVDNYNKALAMTTPNTIFLPGHAQLSTRADLIANRDAIGVIHDRFVKMVAQGMTLEQIRAARPSKEYDARFATENFAPNDVQNSTRWYEQMYNEARTHLAPPR
jgi:glyoxylase-like metal-dependent hydrolase (beta-lactamase superfamily II)